MTHILVLSNGFGEDHIACHILDAIRTIDPQVTLTIAPLVGEGLAYKKHGYTPLFNNPMMPSGGFIRRFTHLLNDLKHGVISTHLKQRKVLKKHRHSVTHTLCIGDVFCMMMAALSTCPNITFMPTAKSDSFMTHSALEKWLIRRTAQQVFTRDEPTAHSLQTARIPATYLGNPMFDNLTPTGIPMPFSEQQTTVGILPGSRDEAFDNLRYILECLPHIEEALGLSQYIVAKAPSLDESHIIEQLPKGWEVTRNNDHTLLKKEAVHVVLCASFPDVLHHVDCCIGLSGTANEQAIYAKKPVLCFEGFGPQSTLKRFREQQRLMGPLLTIAETRDPEQITSALKHILDQHSLSKGLPPSTQSASSQIAKKLLSL